MSKKAEIRYEQLDGLRGIAALAVFVFHAVMMTPPNSSLLHALTNPILRPFWDGPGAVMLFFVLSGFVLTLPYTASPARKIDPIPFLIRRISRLYPAYCVVLIFALMLRFSVFYSHGLMGLSPWLNLHWSQPVDWRSILGHALMIAPNLHVDDIDPVIWSLIIEMKISLVFPLLILLVKRTTAMIYGAMAIALAFALTAPLHFVTHSSSSWSRAAILLPVFLLGSYLARFRGELVARLRASAWMRVSVAIAGTVLYSMVWVTPVDKQSLARWGCALGSGMFILLFLASGRLASIGAAGPIRFLGNVSYSFYLVHLPILITAASLLFPRVHSLAIVVATSLIASLLMAWALYAWIEVPAHGWGKTLAMAAGTAARGRTAPEPVAG